VAKRELAAAIPLLRPTRKIFAEVSPVYAPRADAASSGVCVLGSCDE
ncbi:hypothetical protein EMIHUDRAFT_631960, partial [Emiliania huxleyi CCMP1516]|uniref:Uncharacterized protein n=2 Tax=Emiliania huxleyi TaxID=2903 RepID=A0A0D3KSD2_EMIH1